MVCYLLLTDLTVSYCLSYLYLSNRQHQAKLFFVVFPLKEEGKSTVSIEMTNRHLSLIQG